MWQLHDTAASCTLCNRHTTSQHTGSIKARGGPAVAIRAVAGTEQGGLLGKAAAGRGSGPNEAAALGNGVVPSDQLPQQDAKAVHVGSRGGRAAPHQFRRLRSGGMQSLPLCKTSNPASFQIKDPASTVHV